MGRRPLGEEKKIRVVIWLEPKDAAELAALAGRGPPGEAVRRLLPSHREEAVALEAAARVAVIKRETEDAVREQRERRRGPKKPGGASPGAAAGEPPADWYCGRCQEVHGHGQACPFGGGR